ncbi:MAG: phosphohistidine phosphatase SixA [Betaproteobacteria bacterium]|nr:phosphohistidine phosphatase SixA [Betaproteobacteria bacterium]
MRLYLVQHGEAQPESVSPERELTPRGRSDVERLASLLGARSVRVARVVHSGKTRARQTAEILAGRVAPRIAPEVLECINPNDPVAPVAERARAWTEDSLLAGHLPFVGRMVALLVTGREEPPLVAFQPGSAVCLERDAAGRWVIVWMLRPELLAQ